MNFFCRIFGHTWVHKVDEPKIRWTTDEKTLAELHPTVTGEPHFYTECARCQERGAWAPSKVEERLKSQASKSDPQDSEPAEASA